MANEKIELYKGYEADKAKFPMAVQQKFDGVPTRIVNEGGNLVAYSRQGEVYTSVPHIIEAVRPLLLVPGSSVTGELYIPGMPFKEIGGHVRRKEPNRLLQLYCFDFDLLNQPATPYIERTNVFRNCLAVLHETLGVEHKDHFVKLIPSIIAQSDADVQRYTKMIMSVRPDAEGVVCHSLAKPYQPGTRRWDTMKIKPKPTIDLRIVSYEEAISKDGKPLGMVGRMNAEYQKVVDGVTQTTVIGIGPGKSTHKERKEWWARQTAGHWLDLPRIAEIEYMKDDSYEALRQPTFQQWRDDKEEPDVG